MLATKGHLIISPYQLRDSTMNINPPTVLVPTIGFKGIQPWNDASLLWRCWKDADTFGFEKRASNTIQDPFKLNQCRSRNPAFFGVQMSDKCSTTLNYSVTVSSFSLLLASNVSSSAPGAARQEVSGDWLSREIGSATACGIGLWAPRILCLFIQCWQLAMNY